MEQNACSHSGKNATSGTHSCRAPFCACFMEKATCKLPAVSSLHWSFLPFPGPAISLVVTTTPLPSQGLGAESGDLTTWSWGPQSWLHISDPQKIYLSRGWHGASQARLA